MTDLPIDQLGQQAVSWLSGYSSVDIVLAIFLALHALDGFRRGFIAGALGLAGIFLTVAIAVQAAPLAAILISSYVPIPPLVANAAGFFAVVIVAQLAISLAVKLILVALAPVRLILAPIMVVDHALGFIPSVVQAAIVATLVLTPLRMFPVIPQIEQALAASMLATEIPRRVMSFAPQVETMLGRVSTDASPFTAVIVKPEAEIKVPKQASVKVDPDAETRMLALLNRDRTRAGLKPLVLDEGLREVSRNHSQEMFNQGYFSHTSPWQGTSSDRLRRSGVKFALHGENLAFAPTVEIAHAGLMASPGHRENMMMPEFTRVGIGVMNAGFNGKMFTQSFAS